MDTFGYSTCDSFWVIWIYLIHFGSFGYIWVHLPAWSTFTGQRSNTNPGTVVTASRRLLLLLGQLHLLAMPQLAMEVEFTGKINCIIDGNPIHIYIYIHHISYIYTGLTIYGGYIIYLHDIQYINGGIMGESWEKMSMGISWNIMGT